MDSLSFSQAKEQLLQVIQSATQYGKQFRILSDQGNVVLIPEETYDNILVTLELLSTPGLMDQLRQLNEEGGDFEVESLPQAQNH